MNGKNVKKNEKKETSAKAKRGNTVFPISNKLNVSGFIFVRKKWLAALDWKKDMPLKIDRKADSSITLRKA